MAAEPFGQAIGQPVGGGDLAGRHHEALEIVMVVVALDLVVRGPAVEIVLGGQPQAQEHGGVQPPVRGAHRAGRRPHLAAHLLLDRSQGLGVEQVDLAEHHQVGAAELLLEQLLQRRLVVEVGVLGARRRHRRLVGREPPLGHSVSVDHGDHAVHRRPRADLGPGKGLKQRLGQGQTAGLDQDVLGRQRPVEQLLHGRQEVVGDGAADAAVGQFDDVVVRAAFDAAAAQDLPVDADVAELVDDHRRLGAETLAAEDQEGRTTSTSSRPRAR